MKGVPLALLTGDPSLPHVACLQAPHPPPTPTPVTYLRCWRSSSVICRMWQVSAVYPLASGSW